VHPQHVRDALGALGVKRNRLSFVIPPDILDPEMTIVYPYDDPRESALSRKSFVPFVIEELSAYTVLSQRTKDYYKESLQRGKRPLLYHLVPHVL
jgi:hypothetical protein